MATTTATTAAATTTTTGRRVRWRRRIHFIKTSEVFVSLYSRWFLQMENRNTRMNANCDAESGKNQRIAENPLHEWVKVHGTTDRHTDDDESWWMVNARAYAQCHNDQPPICHKAFYDRREKMVSFWRGNYIFINRGPVVIDVRRAMLHMTCTCRCDAMNLPTGRQTDRQVWMVSRTARTHTYTHARTELDNHQIIILTAFYYLPQQ